MLSEEEAEPYLSKNVLLKCGPDRNGRPCIYAQGKNHFIDMDNHDQNLRTIVHMLEETTSESARVSDGYIAVIIDQAGMISCYVFLARNML